MRKIKKPEPKPTETYFWTEQCHTCGGCGRIPLRNKLGGWYIDYHYQDGHETSGPMTKAEAVKKMLDDDGSVCGGKQNMTLIGPDGLVYTLE